jgi:hypothetical protein
MRALARRVLPVVAAALLLIPLALPSAHAVPAPTAATTLQFYGGEVHAIAQIGNTIYVGGSFTSVGYGSGTIARAYLAALDATSGQLVEGFNPDPKIHGVWAGGSIRRGGAEPGPSRRWWRSGGGLEGDLVAERFELTDVVALGALGVDAGVVEAGA